MKPPVAVLNGVEIPCDGTRYQLHNGGVVSCEVPQRGLSDFQIFARNVATGILVLMICIIFFWVVQDWRARRAEKRKAALDALGR